MKPLAQWSTARLLATLLGGLVLLVAVLQTLETLLPSHEPAPTVPPINNEEPEKPLRPQVRKLGSDTVQVKLEGHRTSTITLTGDSDGADRLLKCIADEIEQAFPETPPEADADSGIDAPRISRRAERRKMRDQLDRITQGCFLDTAQDKLPSDLGELLDDAEPR